MSPRQHQRGNRQPARRIRIRSVRKNPPDIRKLGAAIIALAQAKAEKEAEAEHRRRQAKDSKE